MKRFLLVLLLLAGAGAALFWGLTRPARLPDDALAGLTADAARGEQVFWAAGCASCHSAPGAGGDGLVILSGGQAFASPFGTFYAPNISPDPVAGIGGWSALDLANAMLRGVSPAGQHYYPVFPYASYARAGLQDIVDLKAFLDTLPRSAETSRPHEVGFPYSIRRSLGIWKRLYLSDDWVVNGDLTPEETRGRYLAEALGHCGECHTPRGRLGGMDKARWLAGAPVPGGKGNFPNITPARLKWSTADIAEYLRSGFTPDYDSAGGHMALIVQNLARLPASDRAAIAAYLGKVPPVETPVPAPSPAP